MQIAIHSLFIPSSAVLRKESILQERCIRNVCDLFAPRQHWAVLASILEAAGEISHVDFFQRYVPYHLAKVLNSGGDFLTV
jgi:hypothetical protein